MAGLLSEEELLRELRVLYDEPARSVHEVGDKVLSRGARKARARYAQDVAELNARFSG